LKKNSLQICHAIFFFIELEFLELELHQKLVKFFHGTRVCETRVTWQTQVSQTRVSQIRVLKK